MRLLAVACFLMASFVSANSAIVPDGVITTTEKARDLWIQAIKEARTAVQLALCQLKDPHVLALLLEKAKAGVHVDLIFEENASNQHVLYELQNAGVKVHYRPMYLFLRYPQGSYSASYVIVDGETFVLGTDRLDHELSASQRDFAVMLSVRTHPEEIALFRQLFCQDVRNEGNDWNAVSPSCITIGPDKQRERIIQFLMSAQSSVKLYQERCDDAQLLETLEELVKRGVAVDLLMSPYLDAGNDLNAATRDRLKASGVKISSTQPVRGSVIIVDDSQVWIGTMQLSPTSLDENREISIVVEGPLVKKIVLQFEADKKNHMFARLP